jgi:hypothetical protein
VGTELRGRGRCGQRPVAGDRESDCLAGFGVPPQDLGGGRIGLGELALGELALGASRELGEEEDGAITEDAEGLRIWTGDDAYELVVQQ